ncbi:TOBE domain-containing protein [Streptomyces libani]|uniref:Molybdenum-binding protein n=2 Tax=Streptomyces nigrescens TaxID=1920 RepID=A0A640TX68_STRNI|nr:MULTISPECIES: TOBE domain-containing protein [Streptomyces]MCW7984021.1 adenylate kinase [Streptomyces platensis subsp. clarensis]AWN31919.1 adenylate kinase [Streptomyces sp. NEAU-S7GS2]MYT15472.1 adenylate kinase [Streptomyces sp. SID4951]MYX11772.1 adenylate kinase [Streptomyces sp. SID8375]QIK10285.1 TOBE domain-containing protein [Streptomyces sp. ID38640]
MSLSIRNQIPGTVASVTPGEVMATVKVRLDGGQEITAAITREAVRELGIAEGSAVRTLIKSTEVALATGAVEGLSIRNRIPGTVTEVATGGAMAGVKVAVAGGELTAAITRDAVEDLGLAAGSEVTALIKSTEIALAAS